MNHGIKRKYHLIESDIVSNDIVSNDVISNKTIANSITHGRYLNNDELYGLILEQQKAIYEQQKAIYEQQKIINDQEKAIYDLNKRLEMVEIKYNDLSINPLSIDYPSYIN